MYIYTHTHYIYEPVDPIWFWSVLKAAAAETTTATTTTTTTIDRSSGPRERNEECDLYLLPPPPLHVELLRREYTHTHIRAHAHTICITHTRPATAVLDLVRSVLKVRRDGFTVRDVWPSHVRIITNEEAAFGATVV